jgi:hypothetical protein
MANGLTGSGTGSQARAHGLTGSGSNSWPDGLGLRLTGSGSRARAQGLTGSIDEYSIEPALDPPKQTLLFSLVLLTSSLLQLEDFPKFSVARDSSKEF